MREGTRSPGAVFQTATLINPRRLNAYTKPLPTLLVLFVCAKVNSVWNFHGHARAPVMTFPLNASSRIRLARKCAERTTTYTQHHQVIRSRRTEGAEGERMWCIYTHWSKSGGCYRFFRIFPERIMCVWRGLISAARARGETRAALFSLYAHIHTHMMLMLLPCESGFYHRQPKCVRIRYGLGKNR